MRCPPPANGSIRKDQTAFRRQKVAPRPGELPAEQIRANSIPTHTQTSHQHNLPARSTPRKGIPAPYYPPRHYFAGEAISTTASPRPNHPPRTAFAGEATRIQGIPVPSYPRTPTHLRGLYPDVEHVLEHGEGEVKLVGLEARVHQRRAGYAVRDGAPLPHLLEQAEAPLELLGRQPTPKW